MNAYLLGKIKEKGWLAADADASQVNAQEVCAAKMASGDLSIEEFSDWCTEAKAAAQQKQNASEDRFKQLLAESNKPLLEAVGNLTSAITKAFAGGSTVAAETEEAERVAKEAAERLQKKPLQSGAPTPEEVYKGTGGAPRVKKASESWNANNGGRLTYRQDGRASWQKAGQPVLYFAGHLGTPTMIDEPSTMQYAKIGAWAKWMMRKAGMDFIRLNQHEMDLVKETAHEDAFVGCLEGDTDIGNRKLHDFEVKTVLDDSTSGGQNAVPQFFDMNFFTSPLLYGELLPYVNIIPVARGSSADTFSFGTPTFVSTASGSAVTPFTTTSFVTAFSTEFYPATCAIELGLDFESDAVPNFGQAVMEQIGREALRWCDEQIAVGDGTTEPKGIFTSTGTSASAENGTTGALTYTDALNMVFGMAKQARVDFGGNRTRYVLNDTQYKKFMQIATGVTGDTRPIFGMNVKAYQLGDYPVSIQQSITSGDMAFCNLGAYRLYRRQGIQFTSSTEGRTLMLSNSRLVMARMRWGGQLQLPSTYCVQMLNGSTT